MATSAVSIVIPVWNEWAFTKACLENLRPTLGVHDEVIIVNNGSEDATATGLRHYPWATVIENAENRGFAIACNQGAAAAKNEVVVFLNNDTITPSRWLDGLLSPFADAGVVATGPRSNFVSGPQVVEDVTYALGDNAGLRKFARRWRDEHRGQTSETHRLVGFCIAVRKSAFDAIGGFDEGFGTGGCEDDDLCLRLINNGGKLLICHESFVHHHGHATFDANGLDWFAIQQQNMDRFKTKHSHDASIAPAPTSTLLVSAAMIVKDEADNLPTCLSSLNGVVDEVVIYDTGSTDGSIELARAAGARVIEGYWDDDFSRARNEALAECKGDWILQIDADEVFDGDPRSLRDQVQRTSGQSFTVDIINLSPGERTNVAHRACRLFRRNAFHWTGRLHEQVVPRNGVEQPRSNAESFTLVHSGYLPEALQKKGKVERNIRLAQAELDTEGGRDQADKLANLGRSYMIANRYDEALDILTQARNLGSEYPTVRRTILRSGAQVATSLERPEEALVWADDLDGESTSKGTVRYFRGLAYAQLGRHEDAIATLAGMTEIDDDDGVVFPMNPVYVSRAYSFAGVGDWQQCVAEVQALVAANAVPGSLWPVALEAFQRTGADFSTVVSGLNSEQLADVAPRLATVEPASADRCLEAMWQQFSSSPEVLAAAVRVAPGLAIERALEWSDRLRNSGLAEHCPLLAIGKDFRRSPADRILALAVANGAFEANVVSDLEAVARNCDVSQFDTLVVQINDLAPALLQPFIVGAAYDGDRSFAMAQVLHRLGASDEGVAVLLHGIQRTGGQRIADSAAEWLTSIGRNDLADQIRLAK
jgi:GT2 family glycosyltransferase/tetratricopeptide (TPR) repeat protein